MVSFYVWSAERNSCLSLVFCRRLKDFEGLHKWNISTLHNIIGLLARLQQALTQKCHKRLKRYLKKLSSGWLHNRVLALFCATSRIILCFALVKSKMSPQQHLSGQRCLFISLVWGEKINNLGSPVSHGQSESQLLTLQMKSGWTFDPIWWVNSLWTL